MKNTIRSGILVLICVFSVVFFGGCQKSARPDLEPPVSLDWNLVKSESLFNKVLKGRISTKSIAFSIDEVNREKGVIRVLLKGGNSPADFVVIWNGLIMESLPMQTSLIIAYKGNRETFDPEKEVEMNIDLGKMMQTNDNFSDYYFHLLNGSVDRQITLHPDGVTTSN